MIWLLEHDIFGSGHPLIDAVARAGQKSIMWDDDNWNGAADFLGNPEEPVMFHGSLGNADRIVNLDRWEPGAFCNTTGFLCTNWYSELGPWLLNQRHHFTTVRELVDAPQKMMELLGDSRVFVRPDSPLKPFSGRVVDLNPPGGFNAAYLDHGFYYDDLDLPILVCHNLEGLGKWLGPEWRFIIAKGGVVASSAYLAEGRKAQSGDVPAEALQLAAEIGAKFKAPDPVYVLDLVETPVGWCLLELNPFSGADLYHCDFDAVVSAVTGALT